VTVFATFSSIADGYRSVVISGVFKVYGRHPTAPSVIAPGTIQGEVRRIGDVLLDTWNSMSLSAEHDGDRYRLQFRLRVERGHGVAFQGLVDSLDYQGHGELRQVQRTAGMNGWNVVVLLPPDAQGRGIVSGTVPLGGHVHRGSRAGAAVEHWPRSNVMLLGPGATRYTIGHEIGHVLGLGEGYYDHFLRTRSDSGAQILSGRFRRRTVRGTEGSPMARPEDAGRDATPGQVEAILDYANAALGRSSGGHYGPQVDGYRARAV